MISLQEITKDNWLDVIRLSVTEEQQKFIASNVVSLAQLYTLSDFTAKAVYSDETLVGFAMYGIDEDDAEYWIYRFMIDQKFQGKKYGYEAMQAVITDIRSKKQNQHTTITLSYEPKNYGAKQFYERVGFAEVEGLLISDEQVARYTL